MGTDARWLYLLAGAVVTATVLHRPKRPPLAPGQPVSLMGDALADHLRRPLQRILREQRHELHTGGMSPTWNTGHTMMFPGPETPVILALGLSSPGGRKDRFRSEQSDLAAFIASVQTPARASKGGRFIVVAAPRSPYLATVQGAAQEAGAELLLLPGAACGPDGCTPSLATTGVWAVHVANQIL